MRGLLERLKIARIQMRQHVVNEVTVNRPAVRITLRDDKKQRVNRNDVHLIRHILVVLIQLLARSRSQYMELQHTTVGIQFSKGRPRFARDNSPPENIGRLPGGEERVVALKEAFLCRFVRNPMHRIAIHCPPESFQTHGFGQVGKRQL